MREMTGTRSDTTKRGTARDRAPRALVTQRSSLSEVLAVDHGAGSRDPVEEFDRKAFYYLLG